MKILIAGLLTLTSLSSFAVFEELPAGDIERSLRFTLSPKDAFLCGDQVVGDHTTTAKVERVTIKTNERIYVYDEMYDTVGFNFTCAKDTSKKLTGYFDEIKGNLKLKNMARVFQHPDNSLKCKLDGREQRYDKPLVDDFFIIKKTYGEREISPYESKEIIAKVYDSKGVEIADCDSIEFKNTYSALDEDYLNIKQFETKRAIALNDILTGSFVYDRIGFCSMTLEKRTSTFYTLELRNSSLLPKKRKSEDQASSEDEVKKWFDENITAEKCILQ